DHDRAPCPARLDRLDTEADETVVDEHLVPGLEHFPDHRGANGQIAVARALASRHDDVFPAREGDRAVELAEAELRALQVGDQRDRPPDLRLHRAHGAGALTVLVVGAVREVQAGAVPAPPPPPPEPPRRARTGPDPAP